MVGKYDDSTLREVLRTNVKLRLFVLGKDISQICDEHYKDDKKKSDKAAKAIQAWLRYGNPVIANVEKLGLLLGIPAHALLDPDFNPRVSAKKIIKWATETEEGD